MTAPTFEQIAPEATTGPASVVNRAKPLELDEAELSDLRREALSMLYGADFPMLGDDYQDEVPENSDWGRWVETVWERGDAAVRRRLMMVERNRLFYQGVMWISASGGGWVTPPKPRDAARPVHNMLKPALDHRLTILTEQRPGFRTKPTSQDPEDAKQAQSQQIALEYAFDQQNMPAIIEEVAHWAQTDGVSFLEGYWDPDAGPWHEEGSGQRYPMGDGRSKVWRMEQVRVSPGATATVRPWWWLCRDTIARAQAVREYGLLGAQTGNRQTTGSLGRGTDWASAMSGSIDDKQITASLDGHETVERFKLYCEPSEYLPNGLSVIVVDGEAVFVGDLLFGVVPMIRWTDGSKDPSFYPVAIIEDWHDHNVRVNAVLGRWIESIRKQSGGRIAMRPGAVVQETLVGGILSAIEVKGAGDIRESIMPFEMSGLAADAKELLTFEIDAFEKKSGWNDTSRGSFSTDQSGRAILAQREALERIFAPAINAASKAMVEWAKVTLHMQKWGYDIPRAVAMTGKSRPDLGIMLSKDDFDGICDVSIDPETMMPLPRALRMYMLDEAYGKGLMSPQQYMRAHPFATISALDTPDADHDARARRVCEAIRSGRPVPPIVWQDNEAIHQDVLERELILPDDQDPVWRTTAQQRWDMLAMQASMKAQMGQLPPPQPGSPPPGMAPSPGLPPQVQPMLGTAPGFPTAPVAQMAGESDQQQAGLSFDQRNPM